MLAHTKTLIETDPDVGRMATIDIGFDDNGNLVVIYEIKDYDYRDESEVKYLIVEKEDAFLLSRKLKTGLTQLPDYFDKELGHLNPGEASLSEARTLFRNIQNFLKYNRTWFRVKEDF